MINATFCGLVGLTDGENHQRSYHQPFRLKNTSIQVDIRGWAAGCQVDLAYENAFEEKQAEQDAEFVFPLLDTLGLYNFDISTDDDDGPRKLTAKCLPHRLVPDHNTSENNTTDAPTEISADVIRIPVGRFKPGCEIKITLGLVQQMKRDIETGNLIYELPAILAPRKLSPPNQHHELDANSARDQLSLAGNHVAITDSNYSISLFCRAALGKKGEIEAISVENVGASSCGEDTKTENAVDFKWAQVHFTREHFEPGYKTVQVKVTPRDINLPVLYVEPGASFPTPDDWLNGTAVGAWFEPGTAKPTTDTHDPSLTATATGDDYWLVIDRSGSMSGEKIEQAKTLLLLFIKSLPVGCRFNIIGFGTNYESLSRQILEYTDSSNERALQYAADLKADLQSTKVMGPLERIYREQSPTGNCRFVILITDGIFEEKSEVVSQLVVGNASATSRLFTFGIGDDVNRALLEELARVSFGTASFIQGTADMHAKVVETMKIMRDQSLSGFKLDWQLKPPASPDGGGGAIRREEEKTPSQLADTFYFGKPMMQCLLIAKSRSNIDVIATMKADNLPGDGRHSFEFTVLPKVCSVPEDALVIHRFAAFKRLKELLDMPDRQREATHLSEISGFLCKFTSYVLHDYYTETQATNNADGKVMASAFVRTADFSCPTMSLRPKPGEGTRSTVLLRTNGPIGPNQIQVAKGIVAEVDSFEAIAGLQQVNGSWKLVEEMRKIIGSPTLSSLADLRDQACEAIKQAGEANLSLIIAADDTVIATLIGLAILRRRFIDRRDHWEIIEQKAHAFLRSSKANILVGVEQLVQLVCNCVVPKLRRIQ